MVITEEKVLKALNVLAEQNQLTLLVQIVEKWGEERPKTSKMAYMQAEAFCKLCLLDEALQVLRLVDENPEKKSLQIEILLQRGLVSQAHKMLIMLQSLHPQHPSLESFHKRIRQGVSTPSESQIQEIIRRNDPHELYRLAEQCLCCGKSQVGQKILLNLLQRDIKESQQENVAYIPNRYIQQLVWAHKRNLTSSLSLHALLSQVSYPNGSRNIIENKFSLPELTTRNKEQRSSSKIGRRHSSFGGLFKGTNEFINLGNGKRFEDKYWISLPQYYMLRNAFRHCLSMDGHSNSSGEYLVRSLYFDSPYRHCVMEKKNGIEYRKKYRIRCYGRQDYTFANFEVKYRDKSQVWKKSLKMTPDEVTRFIRTRQLTVRNDFAGELLHDVRKFALKPEIIVQYVREAYVYPVSNVRLTFDKYLSHAGRNTDLLLNTPKIHPYSDTHMIFEIKYNYVLPTLISSLVKGILGNKSSISKYALCWDHSTLR